MGGSRGIVRATGTVTYGDRATDGGPMAEDATMMPMSAARLAEAMAKAAGPGPLEVVVYDRSGAERFRSPCSPAAEGGIARFTSRDAPGVDIADPSLCVVLDADGAELAWSRIDPPGRFAAGRPIMLGIGFR
jgi:hypothetical protein